MKRSPGSSSPKKGSKEPTRKGPPLALIAGGAAALLLVGALAVLLLSDDPPATVGLPKGTTERTATTKGPAPERPELRPPGQTEPTTAAPTPGTGTRPPPRPSTGGAGPGPTTPGTIPDLAPPSEGAVVTLRCKDGAGPLAGVTVELRRNGGPPLGTLTSDAKGEVALPRVPFGDKLEGNARHPLSRETVTFGPIEVKATSTIDLKFARAETGTLRGRIVDEAGEPVRDASLVLVDPRQKGEARLDGPGMGLGPDGSFVATVAAGSYAVNADAPGFCSSDRAYATVAAGGEAGPVELVVLRQGALEGSMRLPQDVTLVLPVAVEVVMEITRGTVDHPYQRVIRRPVSLDASMEFVLEGCDPGAYRVRVEVAAPGQNKVGPWVSATVAPGQRASGLVLTLAEQAVAVRGVVRDDRGVPLEGATVVVRGRQARTDRDGKYAIAGIDPGDLAITATLAKHGAAYFDATFEGMPLAIDLVLPRTGGVRGAVQDGRGPAAGVPVQVVLRSDVGFRPFQASTDAQGQFLVEELPPGSYFVKAGAGADPFDDAGAPTITVRPGEVAELPTLSIR